MEKIRMMRFTAIFVKSVDLEETEIAGSYGLAVDTLKEAEDAALKLARPQGANLVKVLDEDLVVRRTWLPLDN
jgi:hypothetical protein